MSKTWEDMSPDEKLAAIGTAANGGQTSPDAQAYLNQMRKAVGAGWSLPIENQKPDPEAAANSQINAATQRNPISDLGNDVDKNLGIQGNATPPGLPSGMTPQQARTTINPATGLPYSANQPAPSADQQQRNDQAAMRIKYLQKMSQGQ